LRVNLDKIITADHKVIRQINRLSVLNTIRNRQAISRVDISRLTGLNKSTITNIVSKLIDEKLVYEERLGESAIGRKPIILRLNEKSRIYGAIEIRYNRTTLAVCDLAGNILQLKEIETLHVDGEEFISTCGKLLAEMIGAYDATIVGVGVSICMIVNHREGLVYGNNPLKWPEVDVRGILEREIGCKVLVDNDGKAAALGEIWFAPEAHNLSSFVFVLVCEGIGVGLVMNNQVYHGYKCLDGQYGTQLIKFEDEREEIPSENVWEENASDLAVVKRYSEYSGVPRRNTIEQDMQRVIELARRDDRHAVRALKETARYLGVGIANINNGLSPERIIIGGLVVEVWDIVFPELLRQVERQTINKVLSPKNVIIPSTLDSSPFHGAQALAIMEVFGSQNIC
jgi:predicted NBD/HSP70 family sugar kinase